MVVYHKLLGMYVCFIFDAGVVIVIGQFQVLSEFQEFQLSFSFSQVSKKIDDAHFDFACVTGVNFKSSSQAASRSTV